MASSADAALNLRIENYPALDKDFLVWDTVPAADEYVLSVNGRTAASFDSATGVDLSVLLTEGGIYTLTLSAVNDSGTVTENSLTYTRYMTLGTPVDTAFADGVLTWLPVDGADVYAVTLNGISVGTSELSFLDVSDYIPAGGDFTATVTAYSDSLYLLPSAPAEFFFSVEPAPLPVFYISLGNVYGTYVASWPLGAQQADGYILIVEREGAEVFRTSLTDNFADVGSFATDDCTVTVSVAVVAGDRTSAFFTRSFRIENGEVTQP